MSTLALLGSTAEDQTQSLLLGADWDESMEERLETHETKLVVGTRLLHRGLPVEPRTSQYEVAYEHSCSDLSELDGEGYESVGNQDEVEENEEPDRY